MHFTGSVNNSNSYPIVGGTVVVKIFRKQKVFNANGPYVVDQFVAKDNINIDASSSKKIEFDWKVPAYAKSGEYQVATFFTSGHKFNLLGLTFTDDIIGNTYNFNVVGEQDKIVEFDKNSVKINNSPYLFAAFPPHIDVNKDGLMTADVLNETGDKQPVKVVWKTYWWDAQSQENLLDTKSDVFVLKKGEKKNISYTIKDKSHSVYLIVAELDYKDTKSIMGARFVRDGVDITRINFPAITSFPIKSGEKETVFSCLHNTSTDTVSGSQLSLKLVDEAGNLIHEYKYKGDVTGAMMGVKDDFVPNASYDKFSILAELSQGGKVVDKAKMDYDCKDIDPSKCLPKLSLDRYSFMPRIIIISLVLILVILALYYGIKKRNHKIIVSVFTLLILSGCVWGTINSKKALGDGIAYSGSGASVVWNVTAPWLATCSGSYDGAWCWSSLNLDNTNVSVSYNVSVTDLSTGLNIQPNSTLQSGKTLRFAFAASSRQDIYWVTTGTDNDSPYGYWVNNADAAPVSQITSDVSNRIQLAHTFWMDLSVNPPTKSLINTGGLFCGSMNGNYVDCTVASSTATTTINPIFNFSSTYGKFYAGRGNLATVTDPLQQLLEVVQYDDVGDVIGPNYTMNVPAQNIPFTFTVQPVIPDNHAPSSPTITGPTTGTTSTPVSFSFVSTDPDSDQIKYSVDWNNDGIIDESDPSSGYVNSGTSQSSVKTWATAGSKTLKVRAEDSKGATSTWSTYTINIQDEPVVGVCGTANESTRNTQPTTSSELCLVGTSPGATLSGNTYSWTCTQDTPVSCSATKTIDGACGSASNETPVSSQPQTNLCSAGTYSDEGLVNGRYTWTCTSGTTAQCSVPKVVVNGVCGSSNGTTPVKDAPTTNLCSSGTETTVDTQGGYYVWNCNGVGGTNGSCSVPKKGDDPVNGICGDDNGTTVSTQPPVLGSLCSVGDASPVADLTSSYSWSCAGTYGGTNASCVANKQIIAPKCGELNGIDTETTPSGSGLCQNGTSAGATLSGTTYSWSCVKGGSSVDCSANKSLDLTPGVCGDTYTARTNSTYMYNLCADGTSTIPTLVGNKYTWTCALAATTSCEVLATTTPQVCEANGANYCSGNNVMDSCGVFVADCSAISQTCDRGMCTGQQIISDNSFTPHAPGSINGIIAWIRNIVDGVFSAKNCKVDGVIIPNGQSRLFYKDRISQHCSKQPVYCSDGKISNSIFKFRSCIAPTFNEF